MTLIDTLRPKHRRLLRRLRKRIANRENMRRYRNDMNYMQLCPGVDLPLEAGTCGRLIWPESTRCTACRKRRDWLLRHALNPVDVALFALLDGAEADDGEHDDCPDEDCGQAAPRSTSCPHSAIPACAGSARRGNVQRRQRRRHRGTLPALCCPAYGHDPPDRVILGGRLRASESRAVADRHLSGQFAGSWAW